MEGRKEDELHLAFFGRPVSSFQLRSKFHVTVSNSASAILSLLSNC